MSMDIDRCSIAVPVRANTGLAAGMEIPPVKGETMRGKNLGSLPVVLLAAVIAAALWAPLAQAATPAPGYTQFAGCPSPEEKAGVLFCMRSTITGGHFQMGTKDVPLTNPITLSAGLEESGNLVANSKGGLTPVKQKVPGGVVGLTGLTWLLEILGSEALTLYAVTELAGQPNLQETGLTLPIRVHLVNSTLGNNCYVGSFSNPIVLKLTNETTNPPPPNVPITGKFPELSAENFILYGKNGEFVDNAFAAPGASGCVLTLFGFIPISINGLVNSQSGLPSPAGRNETRQNYNLEFVERGFVYP
jgi:hypothetical protein